ncbi:helix-turn-helix domain-containing protein [Clostridium botulinum]|nr:helix-turn-helix transcriptional regulator [Clostridium botulinum]
MFWKKYIVHLNNYKTSKINPTTPGEWIKFHRIQIGWSQMDLALKLGLNKKQGRYLIKDYETRGIYPSREISIKLATLFSTNTTYFYDDYYEFINKNYSNLLKSWRKKNNLTQKQAAAYAKVTYETWNSWENNRTIISRTGYHKFKKYIYKYLR